jgi:hypothetical protein
MRLGFRLSSGLREPCENSKNVPTGALIVRARLAFTALAAPAPKNMRPGSKAFRDRQLYESWAEDALFELERRGYSRALAHALIDSRPSPNGPRHKVDFSRATSDPGAHRSSTGGLGIDFRGKAGKRTAHEERR